MKVENRKLKVKSFTLLEMAVSLLIFAVAIGIAAVSYINLLKANLIAQSTYSSLENLRLVMEKIWREVKYGSNFAVVSPSQLSFKVPRENCKTVTIQLNNQTLTYMKEGSVADNLNDPKLVSVESFQITNSASPFSLTFSVKANAQSAVTKVPVPLNLQMTVAPLTSAFPTEACPQV